MNSTNSFREINIFPTITELVNVTEEEIPRNIIKGPYNDVEQYLDLHFRLLRGDFIAPLRSELHNYSPNNRYTNITVYSPVQFESRKIIRQHQCVKLKKLPAVKASERRFMHGSLVCFTKDNFQTIFFAKVFSYENSELIVEFERPSSTVMIFHSDYTMIEYHVYFEPYFQVLNVLKSINDSNFPMKEYLIDISIEPTPPKYLNNLSLITVEKNRIRALSDWKNTNFYGFNPSQMNAFKAALTQKLTIIQGPPGTGKTFVGLKIAQTLIENQRLWYKSTPILIVCYTNHALDQFLEGILPFTEEILRVGGRSKNKALDKYNLKEQRHNHKDPVLTDKGKELQKIENELRDRKTHLGAVNRSDDVVDFACFANQIPNFKSSWFCRASDDDIAKWLVQDLARLSLSNSPIYQDLLELQEELEGADDICEKQMHYFKFSFKYLLKSYRFGIFGSEPVEIRKSISFLKLPQKLKNKIIILEAKLEKLGAQEFETIESFTQAVKCFLDLLLVKHSYSCLLKKLGRSNKDNISSQLEDLFMKLNLDDSDLRNPYNIKVSERWNLYWHWLGCYRELLQKRLELSQEANRQDYEILETLRRHRDEEIMRGCKIVGMTTTGAARNRKSLEAIESPIVIIEEAAEVLESHVVASLTEHCQQLILLGDHKQLRPKTADYKIEINYKLGISLFERMVMNGIHCHTLNVQHRMRPEISKLITPSIYPVLKDHPSLATSRPEVNCITNSLFFIDHGQPEQSTEGTSKYNDHEASFLIYLARHLLLNGYEPEQITILATYAGQKNAITRLKDINMSELMENVRVTDVDDYQGEESDIILLSLVRNNKRNNIGFLATENRICVALSRARCGLYIMGNIELLSNNSKLWKEVKETLQKQNALGTALNLQCQIHKNIITKVKKASDFAKVPYGGCSLQCGVKLECGHFCKDPCHIFDRDHEDYECLQTCNKNNCVKNPSHLCNKLCKEECGACTVPVKHILECGHEAEVPCCVDSEKFQCKALIAYRMAECGHNIEIECATSKEKLLCTFPQITQLNCGHVAIKKCHVDINFLKCPTTCDLKLECGHICNEPCHEYSKTLHSEVKCMQACSKIRRNCKLSENPHLCRKLCHEICEPCDVFTKKIRTACQHVFKVPCFFDVNLMRCRKRCGKHRICGHKCLKKCFRHPKMSAEQSVNGICSYASCDLCE